MPNVGTAYPVQNRYCLIWPRWCSLVYYSGGGRRYGLVKIARVGRVLLIKTKPEDRDVSPGDLGLGVRFPPPATFLLSVLFGYTCHRMVPLPILGEWGAGWKSIVLAVTLSLSGCLVLVVAIVSFRRHKTHIEPWKPSSKLITSGFTDTHETQSMLRYS